MSAQACSVVHRLLMEHTLLLRRAPLSAPE